MHKLYSFPCFSQIAVTSLHALSFLLAGNPKGAKRALLAGLCIALTWLVTIEVVTLGLKDYIPMIYTTDQNILNAIDVQFYVVAAAIFCDTLHSFLAGIIIGCGWQHVGAVLNILWYWVVGAPLGISLTIAVQLGALGYWIGQATAAFLLLCSYIVVMVTMNWKKRSEVAQKMAVLHYKEGDSQGSDSSTSKDAEATKETPSSDHVGTLKANNNHANPEQNTPKNPIVAKDKCPQCPTSGPKCQCPHIDGNPKDKNENKAMVRWKTVIVRILTAVPFVLLCIGAVVISQMLVYHPTPCNTNITSSNSECLPLDRFQSELYQTMPTSVPLCTSPTVTETTLSHMPQPTPAFMPKASTSNHFYNVNSFNR